MLAHNNATGKVVQPNVEVEICKWVSDGFSYLIGFTGTGTVSAEFLLYVGNEPWYVYQTSPGNRTAYIADRAEKIASGVVVSLRVIHDSYAQETFKGTILGGK